jgi:hypothetical protein
MVLILSMLPHHVMRLVKSIEDKEDNSLSLNYMSVLILMEWGQIFFYIMIKRILLYLSEYCYQSIEESNSYTQEHKIL